MTRSIYKARALQCSQPTINVTVTVNINIDRTFYFLTMFVWWLSIRLKGEVVIFCSVVGDYLEAIRSYLFDDWKETIQLWGCLAKNAI